MSKEEFIKECNSLIEYYKTKALEIDEAMTRYNSMPTEENYEKLKKIVEKYNQAK